LECASYEGENNALKERGMVKGAGEREMRSRVTFSNSFVQMPTK
jgi:hypothetical protein